MKTFIKNPLAFMIGGAGGGAPPIINAQTGSNITFTLSENRSQSVKIDIFIKEAPGKKIVSDSATIGLTSFRSASGLTDSANLPGPITWNQKTVSLFGTKSVDTDNQPFNALPFETEFNITWKGVVAGGDGAPLADGNYTLCLVATDVGDNNPSSTAVDLCDTSVRFTVDSGRLINKEIEAVMVGVGGDSFAW